jgi:hypothetical protein
MNRSLKLEEEGDPAKKKKKKKRGKFGRFFQEILNLHFSLFLSLISLHYHNILILFSSFSNNMCISSSSTFMLDSKMNFLLLLSFPFF